MPALLRDNAADPRVRSDLDLLAGEYSDQAVAAAATEVAVRRESDLAALAAEYGDDTSATTEREPWWRASFVHVRRYRTPYLIAAIVAAVLLLWRPAPLPTLAEAEGTTTLPDFNSLNASGNNAVAPSLDAAPTGLFPFDAATEPSAIDDTTSEPAFDTAVVPVFGPRPLTVVASGYASILGGTPLEQPPPGDGLPVETVGGDVFKYSFVRLAGQGSAVRLRLLTDQGASINDTAAVVDMCHIATATWAATRGEALSAAPAYDSNDCHAAARDANGVFTFTFGADNPADINGWAIVPETANNATFQVTFAPKEEA